MTRINRRRLLQLSSGGAVAAGTAAWPRFSLPPRACLCPGHHAAWSGIRLCAGLRPDHRTKINEQAEKDLGIKIISKASTA